MNKNTGYPRERENKLFNSQVYIGVLVIHRSIKCLIYEILFNI